MVLRGAAWSHRRIHGRGHRWAPGRAALIGRGVGSGSVRGGPDRACRFGEGDGDGDVVVEVGSSLSLIALDATWSRLLAREWWPETKPAVAAVQLLKSGDRFAVHRAAGAKYRDPLVPTSVIQRAI